MMTRYAQLLFIPFVLFSLVVHANAQPQDDLPAAVVRDYFSALQSEDWERCASLVHPESLKKIRQSSDKLVNAIAPLDRYGGNLNSYFGVTTLEEYGKLSDRAVFKHAIRLVSSQPGYHELLKATKYRIIGSLKETDTLVHVVYHSDVELIDENGQRVSSATFPKGDASPFVVEVKLPPPEEDRAELISVKKDGETWKVLLRDEPQHTLDEIEKAISNFKDSMRKFVSSASAQKAKTSKKTGRKARSH